MELTISQKHARQLALFSSLLLQEGQKTRGKQGVFQIIDQLGYIQIDTISVIERAHHHTLWNRVADYDPLYLDQLQSKDRLIYEYWGHAASYLPMKDYRYSIPVMKRFHNPKNAWERNRLDKYGHMMPEMLRRIRSEGPVCSSDFKNDSASSRGPWWDWHPAKNVLELLFWQGELMISSRRNFQRVYDLTENVLPDGIDTREPSPREYGHHLVKRALQAYGLAAASEIREHIKGASKELIEVSIRELLDEGTILPVKTAGSKTDYFILSDNSYLDKPPVLRKTRIRLLSPFDNAIIQRKRIQRLFDFDYTLECYIPTQKRKFGYFSLPVMRGAEFIGRLDTKAHRSVRQFEIKSAHWEDGVLLTDEDQRAILNEIRRFAAFNQCPEPANEWSSMLFKLS